MAESNTTDGGRIVKMEVDYSSTCDEKIPVCKVMALEGKINEALEILYALEKQTRTVSISFNLLVVVPFDSSLSDKGSGRHLHRAYPGGNRTNLL